MSYVDLLNLRLLLGIGNIVRDLYYIYISILSLWLDL